MWLYYLRAKIHSSPISSYAWQSNKHNIYPSTLTNFPIYQNNVVLEVQVCLSFKNHTGYHFHIMKPVGLYNFLPTISWTRHRVSLMPNIYNYNASAPPVDHNIFQEISMNHELCIPRVDTITIISFLLEGNDSWIISIGTFEIVKCKIRWSRRNIVIYFFISFSLCSYCACVSVSI